MVISVFKLGTPRPPSHGSAYRGGDEVRSAWSFGFEVQWPDLSVVPRETFALHFSVTCKRVVSVEGPP